MVYNWLLSYYISCWQRIRIYIYLSVRFFSRTRKDSIVISLHLAFVNRLLELALTCRSRFFLTIYTTKLKIQINAEDDSSVEMLFEQCRDQQPSQEYKDRDGLQMNYSLPETVVSFFLKKEMLIGWKYMHTFLLLLLLYFIRKLRVMMALFKHSPVEPKIYLYNKNK